MEIIRQCQRCSKSFSVRKPSERKRFCSRKCSNNATSDLRGKARALHRASSTCSSPGCVEKIYIAGRCQRCYAMWRAEESATYKATCPQCNVKFGSSMPKKYCSQACWHASDQFRTHVASLSLAAGEARNISIGARIEVTCFECGKTRSLTPSLGKVQRFCSKLCWRRWNAKRFDRWVASPETIALPQNYDEFLSKSELPCLVHGCGWVGQQLSSHMNATHGVSAAEFKKLAGFNKSSGILGAKLVEKLSLSQTREMREATSARSLANKPWVKALEVFMDHGDKERRLEGKEHVSKAVALTKLLPRKCERCSVVFAPERSKARFCSKSCSSKTAAEKRTPKQKLPIICHACFERVSICKNLCKRCYQRLWVKR